MSETHEVRSRSKRYLVGRCPPDLLPMDEEPMDMGQLQLMLNEVEGVTMLDQIGTGNERVFVVEMEPKRATLLQEQMGTAVLVEEDFPLELFGVDDGTARMLLEPGLDLYGDEIALTIVVKERAAPHAAIPNAMVALINGFFPAKGRTDAQGRVTLTLFGESAESVTALYVNPRDTNHWNLWIDNPTLNAQADNVIQLRRLNETLPKFPTTERYGWGQQAMGLASLMVNRRGKGVRIAVIDSGIHIAHRDLGATGGQDFRDTSPDPDNAWQQDVVGHGSHCAGVIAGLTNAVGVNGFAPAADLFGYRVFEGGKISWLIKSLERCIDEQIDVVNLSLGSASESQHLHQAVRRAVDAGVVLVAAAGNSANAVNYPARWPEVIAVSAIGEFNSYPEDSRHAKQVGDHQSDDGRFFSARFTCFGPEIDVCAPGVAVVSSVPENGYGAWDGTSMACPHITGLVALILGHRTDLSALQIRNGARTAAVREVLQAAATDLGMPVDYQGAGLPDVRKVLRAESVTDDNYWQQLSELLTEALALAKEGQAHN